MLRAVHPEILSSNYLPPVPVGRRLQLRELVDRMTSAARPDRTTFGIVLGPGGSGSSTVARMAAHALADGSRATPETPLPLVASVRVRWCAGPIGVASALFLHLDDGFRPRGFHVAEILAGFLRRLRRAGRRAIVVLDDLGPNAADLSDVLRALRSPDRFLPEGEGRADGFTVLLAGRPEATRVWRLVDRLGLPVAARTMLPAYSVAELRSILVDRANRVLGRAPPEAWVDSVLEHESREGRGATGVIERLRRESLDPDRQSLGGHPAPPSGELRVEPRVLRALERAAAGGEAPIAELRHWEGVFAREEGVRPLPTTTLWRRVVHLETAGLVRREVRPGGPGGTRSSVVLLRSLRGIGVGVPVASTLPASGPAPPPSTISVAGASLAAAPILSLAEERGRPRSPSSLAARAGGPA